MAGTLTVEELKGNVVELQHRAVSHLSPMYQVQQVWDPEKRRIVNLSLTQIEWWDQLNRIKAWAQTSRDPICKLAEARASVDDYTFIQLRKVFEDLLVQIDLLSNIIEIESYKTGRTKSHAPVAKRTEAEVDELPDVVPVAYKEVMKRLAEDPDIPGWDDENAHDPLPEFEAASEETAATMEPPEAESDDDAGDEDVGMSEPDEVEE